MIRLMSRKMSSADKLTFVNKTVAALEQVGRRLVFAGVKRERDRAVKRDATSRRNRTAVATAERRVDELGGIR